MLKTAASLLTNCHPREIDCFSYELRNLHDLSAFAQLAKYQGNTASISSWNNPAMQEASTLGTLKKEENKVFSC